MSNYFLHDIICCLVYRTRMSNLLNLYQVSQLCWTISSGGRVPGCSPSNAGIPTSGRGRTKIQGTSRWWSSYNTTDWKTRG